MEGGPGRPASRASGRIYRDPAWRDRARPTTLAGVEPSLGEDRRGGDEGPRRSCRDRSSTELAAARGTTPFDLMLDLALADDLATRFRVVMDNDGDDEIGDLLADKRTLLGLSDAGAHASQLCDACYSTHLLGHWVRERKALSLEDAVWRLTGQPHQAFRIADRGLVREGFFADLVAFDPTTVGTTPVDRVSDQPGGADRLLVRSTGMRSHVGQRDGHPRATRRKWPGSPRADCYAPEPRAHGGARSTVGEADEGVAEISGFGRSRGERREKPVYGAPRGERDRPIQLVVLVVVALEGQEQRRTHDGADRDVERLELVSVPILNLAPRLLQSMRRDREVILVEVSGDLGITEKDEAEKREHLLEGRDELVVETVQGFQLALGCEWLIAVDDLAGGHQIVDGQVQWLDDGLQEEMFLAVEVLVDDRFAYTAMVGDRLDGRTVDIANLAEGLSGGLQDRTSASLGREPASPGASRWRSS